ncbi:MAG: hypothetical protein V8T31_08880 [Lachnospiraceae bacterium]
MEEKEGCALFEIELFTGRHHQIRVQMAASHMPLAGTRSIIQRQKKENRLLCVPVVCSSGIR